MSQRLEPEKIFHKEILVPGKYPKSFPPRKTIPRGSQARSQRRGVPVRLGEAQQRARPRGRGLGEAGRVGGG